MVALGTTLPDLETLNAEALKDLLRATHQQLLARQSEIEHLRLLITQLKRMQFGRKSEKLQHQIEQLELRLEGLQSQPKCEAGDQGSRTAEEESSGTARPAHKPSRRPLPEHLPRETQTLPPEPQQCPECQGKLRPLGEDVSEILEYVPARFKVIRYVRPKLSCSSCAYIVQAPAPTRPVERGLAGPGLLAHVLVSKYADHQPLYRQSEMYRREGVDLERSTLADWVGAVSRLLDPLVEALRRYVMGAGKLHADETPVPVLAPGQGKTKTGRLWTYVRDDRPSADQAAPAVWFSYSPDRRGEHPQKHLRDFHGILQADAYAGFQQLYDNGQIQEAACWAHVRRKFYDIHLTHASPWAAEVLERIAALYGIEKEIRGRPPEERREVRQTRARPLLESLRQWFEENLTQLSRKSDTAIAIRYALSRWPALVRYCENGRIEMDNNAAERALRAVALGRKNYLFAGSDAGGERAAAIYSLLGSARLCGLDPEAYLRLVLTRIADSPITQIEELLPWKIAANVTLPTQPAT